MKTEAVNSGPMFDLMVALKEAIDKSIDRDDIGMGDALCAMANAVAYIVKDVQSPADITQCLEFVVTTTLSRLAYDRATVHEGTGAIN